jgi:hypothetical protein
MFFIQELTLQHEGESTVVSETWTCHFSGGTYRSMSGIVITLLTHIFSIVCVRNFFTFQSLSLKSLEQIQQSLHTCTLILLVLHL